MLLKPTLEILLFVIGNSAYHPRCFGPRKHLVEDCLHVLSVGCVAVHFTFCFLPVKRERPRLTLHCRRAFNGGNACPLGAIAKKPTRKARAQILGQEQRAPLRGKMQVQFLPRHNHTRNCDGPADSVRGQSQCQKAAGPRYHLSPITRKEPGPKAVPLAEKTPLHRSPRHRVTT